MPCLMLNGRNYTGGGSGGGSGSSYTEDTLWSNASGVDSTSQGVSINLSGNISDYDVIVFEAGRSDGSAYRKGQVWYLTSSLVIGTNHLQVIENNLNANVHWIHDSDTSITWASAYSAYPTTLFSIKGLKFGSGGGGGYTATELVSSTITVAQDPGTPFTFPKPYTDYDLISITALPDTAYGNSVCTQFTVSTAGLEIGKSYIFNIDPGRNVAIYFTVTSSTQFTFLRGWQAYAYYITSIIGMEFGGEHAGVPGIATLLWENSSPSSGMAADTVITISTLQKYDLIGIVPIHNVSDNLATNAMQLFSTENTSVNNQLITANSGNANNYARTFTITNGTTLTFSNGMQPGIAYNSNYAVPLRIYGFRFGNEGSSNNYSTTEHKVGKWIDGSDIYEKTYTNATEQSVSYQTWTNTGITANGINQIINLFMTRDADGGTYIPVVTRKENGYIQIFAAVGWTYNNITIQYTKSSS